jgi:ubiquinone/menaquinone biosynthesis C-methylase UbiE
MNNFYSKDIEVKIKDYYTGIYKKVGLNNISESVASRLSEETQEAKRIDKIEGLIGLSFGKGQKHLIIGTGTGGLAVALYKRGCEVYGVEPNQTANDIVRMKAESVGMQKDKFTTDKAESLPFQNGAFDFIHCVSVIEHVNDVKKSLNEMIRVLKPGGCIYLSTPNFSFPYERHYKIAFPTFLPRLLGYLYLLLKGKPVDFYGQLNFVTEKNINRILFENKEPVTWQRFYEQYSYLNPETRSLRHLFWRFYTLSLNVPMNQEVFIRKIEKPKIIKR